MHDQLFVLSKLYAFKSGFHLIFAVPLTDLLAARSAQVSLLKREVDCLESEVNRWARGSQLPSLRPMLGTDGGRHGAAAVLACVWPLAALVVEFVTIPPVANPPAASAVNAPTPSAAALAILTAAADDGGSPPCRSGKPFARPSPMQGILQWLDTGVAMSPMPSSLETPDDRTTLLPTESSSRDVPAATSTAGWRAWALLDATVDLIAPTGDTLLWDARYRHDLSAETGAMGGSGKGVYTAWALDPVAENVLDWGRRGGGDLGSSAHPRRSAEGRGIGDGGGGFLGGGDWGGGENDTRRTWFLDSQGRNGDPLADAGGVPWVLARMLLAIFVSGGAAEGHAEADTSERPPSRRLSGGSGKGGGGTGTGPPSIALVALQRLIALLNSLESSGYQHFEFEVLHMAARVSAALRTTRLTPQSAWVLGALQLLVRRSMHASNIALLMVRACDTLARAGVWYWGLADAVLHVHAGQT